jgi:hypothetical protein
LEPQIMASYNIAMQWEEQVSSSKIWPELGWWITALPTHLFPLIRDKSI